jgi:hypothetical protein
MAGGGIRATQVIELLQASGVPAACGGTRWKRGNPGATAAAQGIAGARRREETDESSIRDIDTVR